ncbi:MAG: ABC transporter permease [Kofleriaceae bacterium]|nr:ABC transporter permease [Myxococcales bacterium]MCB9561471.1 ABC transporter permease [Kofleriaceae bacterium]MCB9573525.1 ABC transporter permease [Kofleriaceae bacterium]
MAAITSSSTVAAAPAGRSLWADAWRRLRRNTMAVASAGFVLFVVVVCVVGPWLASAIAGLDSTSQDVAYGARGPTWQHWLGTDPLGRDMMVRVMLGGRLALAVALVATAVALVLGVGWGAVAGYVGGRVDDVMMRIVDVLYGFPVVVFIIVVMSVIGTHSLVVLFALIGAVSWMTMARIVRGQIMSLRHQEFVEAARALGAGPGRIIVRHLLPNSLGPIIVYATLSLPYVMLTEAFLSFLGLGVQAPQASWGTLVAEGAEKMVVYPWLLIGPGLLMAATIFALNFLGDGLRDALDPQTRRT